MKKVLSIILAMLVLTSFVFFAVGSSDEDATTSDPTYNESTLEGVSESVVDVTYTETETTETTTVEEETTTEKATTEKVTVAQTVVWDVPPATTVSESSKTVYITKTGKKYHYENPCGNGKYYASTLAEAKSKGLGPCEKCVLH